MLALPHTDDLTDLNRLEIHADSAQVVTWCGRPALCLENGLALLREPVPGQLSATVEVGADGPCYPGLAFQVEDAANYELVYAQPHTSGLWDAMQYDPVFRGSNTWQLYHGPAYQQSAIVPTGSWFRLELVTVAGRAAAWVDRQPPLCVARLAHGRPGGRLGVWTYRRAFFSGLRLAHAKQLQLGRPASQPTSPPETLKRWHLQGVGPIEAEENGTLNLNRYLDWQPRAEAVLTSSFSARHATTVELRLGYSDELDLDLDGQPIHTGCCTFRDTDSYEGRGYVVSGAAAVQAHVAAGRHQLSARLRTVEPFGWGLTVALHGEGLSEKRASHSGRR